MNQDQTPWPWWKDNRYVGILAALTLTGLLITTILRYWQRWALIKASALRNSHHESQRYKLLKDINCFLGDRIAAFIINRLDDRWSPAITAGVVVVISLFLSVILALVTGRFFHAPGYRALLADSYYFIAEGLIAVIWITYIWICKAPFHVIQQLQEEATVDSNSNEFNEAKALLNSRLPTILAGAILNRGHLA